MSRVILTYCLEEYEGKLPGVNAIRAMTDRQLVVRAPWATPMVHDINEATVVHDYHRGYLLEHLGGQYGVEQLHVVMGSGRLVPALLDEQHFAWLRQLVAEGHSVEPYHWLDADLWHFAEQLGGDQAVVATRREVAGNFGNKARLRLTASGMGRENDFAPHRVSWSLSSLKDDVQGMLLQCSAVRVVFDGDGASGDGASVFQAPFNEVLFDREAMKWCKHRDSEAPFLVEQWFEGDVLPISCTWRVRDGETDFRGLTRQFEKVTEHGTRAHKGNFTSSRLGEVFSQKWRQRYDWSEGLAERVAHEVKGVIHDHYVLEMAHRGWNGPACFDIIVFPDGAWKIVEVNDRNYGSRPASDLLEVETDRLNSDRCVLLFNIEDLPPTRIETWIGALKNSSAADAFGDLSKPEGPNPWCMLLLPRASVQSGKIIGQVSAGTPEEANLVREAVLRRIRHAAMHLFHSNSPAEAK